MLRRTFLNTSLAAGALAALRPAVAPAAMTGQIPMGYNTYCLRALKWNDSQHFEYAASMKLDAVFLQDSLDPQTMEPAHWKQVREQTQRLGLHIETGGAGTIPENKEAFNPTLQKFHLAIDRAAAMGASMVRYRVAGDREHLPPGTIDQHIETMVTLLRAVRSRVMDAGLKVGIENHKDFQCWETRQLIEAAGKEFVGAYLDTGNPVFVMEDPMTTVETLGPYAVSFHLRDSIVYEHPKGIAVQWVPLGEGTVDFKKIIARAREIMPPVHIYIKPITGRPPQVLPVFDAAYWKSYPNARAGQFAAFLALAKRGTPYDRPMVIEDLQNRAVPAPFAAAVQYQQKEHMERSIAYARKTLDLGVRWRA